MAKIAVAMSGGVDSTSAALLLQREGHELVGVTLRLFDDEASDGAVARAAEACRALGLPHHVCDQRALFAERVMDHFVCAYLEGVTPNPCIECNRHIKFAALFDWAAGLGCSRVATGHYARVERDMTSGRWLLRRGLDPNKDQSYVLYALTQNQLGRALFPLGGLTKEEVRALAAAGGLESARAPESQDICFVPDGDYAGFILRRSGTQSPPGDIIDAEGRVLGRHRGLVHYTIGQRKGLGGGFEGARYVLSKDVARNTLTIGTAPELQRQTMKVGRLNLISRAALTGPIRAEVKARYGQRAESATVTPDRDGGATVTFDRPQRALTPGQAAVFYDGDLVIGGGTILP